MFRVLSAMLTAVDGRRLTLLGLLDMPAAFDCVDHSLYLQRLENFGLTATLFLLVHQGQSRKLVAAAYVERGCARRHRHSEV